MAYQVQCTHFEGETKESGIAVYKKCQKVKLEKRPQSSRGKVRACCPGEAVRLCTRRPHRVAFIVCRVLSRFSRVRLFATRLLCPWDFSRQEYWSGFLCPSPKELHDPGIERLPRWQAGCLPLAPPGKPRGSAH